MTQARAGKPVGLTGKPGAGKSTFVYRLRQEGITAIDEFWEPDPDYGEKRYRVNQLMEQHQPVVVAAAQLDPEISMVRFHVVTSPETRLANIAGRRRNINDFLRAKYFRSFEWRDNFLFDSERVWAQYLIQSR